MKENFLISKLLIRATELGHRLFRNNIGTYRTPKGDWIKYGLCNPGGSDLIGWTTVTVTPQMVGQRIAIFTAVEAKTSGTRTTLEQHRFKDAVIAAGGIAVIAHEQEDYENNIRMRQL